MIYKCICGKEFESYSKLGGHAASCKIAKDEKKKQLQILKIEENDYCYACNCGRRFKTPGSLNSHARFCEQYQKKEKQQHNSKYFNNENKIYTCECGYETKNHQSLNSHFSHCKIHKQVNNKDCSEEYWNARNHTGLGHMLGWDKFTDDQIKEIHKKSGETLKRKISSGELVFKSHKHTEETKKRLSEKRRENLKKGIGNHWICPFIKRSYAEQYFLNCFNNENLNVQNNVWVDHYCLDFVLNNYYFEVDGEQHYSSEDTIKKDEERTEYLKSKGYILIDRCRWKTFIKLSYEEKQEYVNNIIKQFKKH